MLCDAALSINDLAAESGALAGNSQMESRVLGNGSLSSDGGGWMIERAECYRLNGNPRICNVNEIRIHLSGELRRRAVRPTAFYDTKKEKVRTRNAISKFLSVFHSN